MNPALDPAVDYVRALPWVPSILAAGAIALVCAIFALARRHPGEAGLGLGAAGLALLLVLAELGRPTLGLSLLWVAVLVGTGAAFVAGTARAVPGAPRVAPGNEQRLLAIGIAGLLMGSLTVAALAVDWPEFDPAVVSTIGVAAAIGAAGIVGLLTRRHWLGILLGGEVVVFGLAVAAAALPGAAGPGANAWAALLLAWAWALGVAGLALVQTALARGHGPWVEPFEDSSP
ncbi:MAG: hypothetical protein ACREOU_12360 [Candidatus Eiseniibacteriota bacterium]